MRHSDRTFTRYFHVSDLLRLSFVFISCIYSYFVSVSLVIWSVPSTFPLCPFFPLPGVTRLLCTLRLEPNIEDKEDKTPVKGVNIPDTYKFCVDS